MLGLLLFGMGAATAMLVGRDHRAAKAASDPREAHHLHGRVRRRLQVSGLLCLLGIAIPAGDLLPVMQKEPVIWAIFWICILLLVFWVILLALADFVASAAHLRWQQNRLRREIEVLEDQARAIQTAQRAASNGHPAG